MAQLSLVAQSRAPLFNMVDAVCGAFASCLGAIHRVCVSIGGELDKATKEKGWNAGLCGCFGDCNTLGSTQCHVLCCMQILAPCQVGLTEKAVGGNFLFATCCMVCCPPCMIANQRTKIRAIQNLEGSCAKDWVLACCCPPCTMAQSATQVGEAAQFNSFTIEALLTPATKAELAQEAANAKLRAKK